MALTYTWRVLDLIRGSDTGGVSKVIWSCVARNTLNDFVELIEETELVYDSTDPSFTSYDSLTESQVLNWIWAVQPKADVERKVNVLHMNKYGEALVVGLPW